MPPAISTLDRPDVGAAGQAARPVPPRTGGGLRAAWAWALAACALLGGSGAVRAMQERQHASDRAYKETCPIDLSTLPEKFSGWKIIKEGTKQLDADVMKVTGGTDHVTRTYANNLTGVMVMVLVLYGPAEPVLPHTPQVCYPGSGFEFGEAAALRTIKYQDGVDAKGLPVDRTADFLSASFHKPNGRQVLREAVYHSFRFDGEWSPFIGGTHKFARRNPGIFKVQIQRMMAEGETLGPGDPLEQFLGAFVTKMEESLKQAAKVAPAAGTPAAG